MTVLLYYCITVLLQYYITAYFLHTHVLLQCDYNELLDYLLSCLDCIMDCPLARFEPPRKHKPADTLGKPKMRHKHQVRSLHIQTGGHGWVSGWPALNIKCDTRTKHAACAYKQEVMIVSVGALDKPKMRNTHQVRSLRRKNAPSPQPAHANKGSWLGQWVARARHKMRHTHQTRSLQYKHGGHDRLSGCPR